MTSSFGKSFFLFVILLACASLAPAQSNCNGLTLGQEGRLNGFVPFPSSSLWNTNIANAPLDPNSDAIINFIGGSTQLHPDFGAGLYQGHTFGIPYVVVVLYQDISYASAWQPETEKYSTLLWKGVFPLRLRCGRW